MYSSYKYLITNSIDLLRFFKEPIFIWGSIPDDVANVLLTYIIGAILPLVSLALSEMVTERINLGDDGKTEEPKTEEETTEESIEEEVIEDEETPTRESGFINL